MALSIAYVYCNDQRMKQFIYEVYTYSSLLPIPRPSLNPLQSAYGAVFLKIKS